MCGMVSYMLCYVGCEYWGLFSVFFFQAEDGIRDLVRSRGLGDVYKRQMSNRVSVCSARWLPSAAPTDLILVPAPVVTPMVTCLLYTSDAADDLLCVDLGGRRIIKKKTNNKNRISRLTLNATNKVYSSKS